MKRLYPMSFAAAMVGMALTANTALAQSYPPGPPTHVIVINHPAPPPTHVVVYNHPPGPPGNWHQWRPGDHYTGNRVVVYNYAQYRLRPPPPGYQWVQDGGQFVLIAVATGIVADIILNSAYQ